MFVQWCIPYGDMMFFASLKMMLLPLVAMMRCLPKMWRSHASLGVAVIIGRSPASFAEGKHHSKKPNLSGRQIRLFCWWRQLEANQWPHACQACALTSWAMPPQRLVLYHTFFQKSIGFCKFLFFLLSPCLPTLCAVFFAKFQKIILRFLWPPKILSSFCTKSVFHKFSPLFT